MTRILITSALPYINGIKHLGNLAGSMLPADVFARFHRATGAEVLFICATDEHGTPCWFELNARDYAGAVDFYTSVFGLSAAVWADSDEFRYTTLVSDGKEIAGILDASSRLAPQDASNWVVYWQVDDVDATLSRLRELGGTVHEGPMDSPFGRIASVADPAGAVFKLRSSPPQ